MDNINEIVGSSNASAPSNTLRPQTVIINDKRELYKCYMPFIKGGGLFIPFNDEVTASKLSPGQKIFVLFSMLESKQKIPINGKVVWINKGGASKGYGIAFGDSPPMKTLRDNIESSILELTAKREPTYTL
jgi:type IV pilus assembly protein PilZ